MDKNRRNRIAIISIMTYYARQIFDETKLYEFRKSPLRDELLNKKIYVYSEQCHQKKVVLPNIIL